MIKIFGRIFLSIILCTFATAAISGGVAIKFEVKLQANTEGEKLAKLQLERVAAQYDLTKWIQTKSIVFDETTIPHSHPVLTLHARHVKDDGLFLSTFIHEQMHWWLAKHKKQTAAAMRDLKAIYTTLPVGYPDGADSLEASYEHLLVNCLELDAVRTLLGEAEESRMLAFWSGDHYRKLYVTVGQDREKIRAILRKHGLLL